MHYNGWVFGPEVDQLMESLTHPFGHTRPEVMVPMEIVSDEAVELPMWRSGWALVHPDPSVPIWCPDEEDFLTIVWPTAVLRDLLGPCALLRAGETDSTGVARRHIAEIDGQWYAGVPRFFHTVGDYWSRLIQADRLALVTTSGQEVPATTVADMDLEASFKLGGPSLIVGPEGPVYHDISWGRIDKDGSIARRRAATDVLMTLPGETPVTAIDFHT